MKKSVLLLSVSLMLPSTVLIEKESVLVNENPLISLEEKEEKKKNNISPAGVWLPGGIEDEELP